MARNPYGDSTKEWNIVGKYKEQNVYRHTGDGSYAIEKDNERLVQMSDLESEEFEESITGSPDCVCDKRTWYTYIPEICDEYSPDYTGYSIGNGKEPCVDCMHDKKCHDNKKESTK